MSDYVRYIFIKNNDHFHCQVFQEKYGNHLIIKRRRQWQPSPVFLPGESQGRGSLVGCHLWCCTESDTTEVAQQQQQLIIKIQLGLTYPFSDWNIKIRVCVCVHACSVASVVSNSLQPYELQPTRLLCPCDSSGKNTGMGCHLLLQAIFVTQ